MTCGHCVAGGDQELAALDGVSGVEVELVAGGTVHGDRRPATARRSTEATVAAAVDEAGLRAGLSPPGTSPERRGRSMTATATPASSRRSS